MPTVASSPVSIAFQVTARPPRDLITARISSQSARRTRIDPDTTPGTSHGVRTVCGHASCTVGGAASAPVAATRSIHRPGSTGQVSVARPAPVACATHMSEPVGSGPAEAVAVPGTPAAAVVLGLGLAGGVAVEALDDAVGPLAVGAVVEALVGVATASACQLASPVTRVMRSDPTQPFTSVSRPMAITTGPDPGTLAVTVTGCPASDSTPGSATSTVVPAVAVVVAARTDPARHTVAEAMPRAMSTAPRTPRRRTVSR